MPTGAVAPPQAEARNVAMLEAAMVRRVADTDDLMVVSAHPS